MTVSCDLNLDTISDPYSLLVSRHSYSEGVPVYQKYYHISFKGGNKVSRSLGIQKSQLSGHCDCDQMTLSCDRDPTILTMYLHTSEFSTSTLAEVIEQYGRKMRPNLLPQQHLQVATTQHGRYGSFRQWMNVGCAGKTMKSLENACHT